MKTACDSAGNPVRQDRHWNDAWFIMLDILLCVTVGIGMLLIDVYDAYDNYPCTDAREDFVARMRMALDEIPMHLRGVNFKG